MWRQVAVTLAVCGLCSAYPELKVLGSYPMSDPKQRVAAMAASGDKVLVGGFIGAITEGKGGFLTLLNGSDVNSVSEVNTIKFQNYVTSIYPEGDHAYVLSTYPNGTHLHRVGIKERLTDPVMVWSGAESSPYKISSIIGCGPYLCVRTNVVTILRHDGSIVGTLEALYPVISVAASGDTLFLVVGGSDASVQWSVQTVDLGLPFGMKFFRKCSEYTYTLTAAGDLLYINNQAESLVIVNITSNETLSTFTHYDFCVSGNILVHNELATWCGYYLLDVSNPRAPFIQYQTLYGSTILRVVGDNLWSLKYTAYPPNAQQLLYFYAYPPGPPTPVPTPVPTHTPAPTPAPTPKPTPTPPPSPSPSPSPGPTPPSCSVCTKAPCCNPYVMPVERCPDLSACCHCGTSSCQCPTA